MIEIDRAEAEIPRYRWWVWPNRRREGSKPWHWYRLALTVVLVAAAITGIEFAPHLACADGLVPSASYWSEDDECVGVTSGPYAFKLDRFGPVMAKIAEQNDHAGDLCPPGASTITVAVLSALTSPLSGGRAVHEIEGIAAAQARLNGAGCVHPVKLQVANLGTTEQAATEVAEKVKADQDVVAVVGPGLSDPNSAAAANLLGSSPSPVPMVADLITAEGFDSVGSQGKEAGFRSCAATYPNGVGHGYLYRVAYPNSAQIAKLAGYLGNGRPNFVVTPTDLQDPYTCTAFPLVQARYDNQVAPIKFDPADAATVSQIARHICGGTQEVNVFYTARSKDLSRFIQSIDEQDSSGPCPSITVLSTSDASRLRALEPGTGDESVRTNALNSRVFRDGKLKLIYTPLADSDSLANNTEFMTLSKQFSAAGVDPSHLDDGWAVNGYDALLALVHDTRMLNASHPVTRGEINSGLSALSPSNEMAGAGGRIAFDTAGNRTGAPTMVRLCPSPTDDAPFSVPVSSPADAICR